MDTYILLFLAALLLVIITSLFGYTGLDEKSLAEIDQMTGEEFEKFIKQFLKSVGWKVERTPIIGDFGVDLIAQDGEGNLVAIQLKRWTKNVGVKAVQEVVAGQNYYGTDKAMVITNSYFTAQAIMLANRNNVILVDRNALRQLFEAVKKHKNVEIDTIYIKNKEDAKQEIGVSISLKKD